MLSVVRQGKSHACSIRCKVCKFMKTAKFCLFISIILFIFKETQNDFTCTLVVYLLQRVWVNLFTNFLHYLFLNAYILPVKSELRFPLSLLLLLYWLVAWEYSL